MRWLSGASLNKVEMEDVNESQLHDHARLIEEKERKTEGGRER